LAAHNLGANVILFDLDPESVACTLELKHRFASEAEDWKIKQGSCTDGEFLSTLGTLDIVYCRGVAHHTGQMWSVIENLSSLVNQDGSIVLAVYNDEQYISQAWHGVKQVYPKLPSVFRPVLVVATGSIEFGKRLVMTVIASLLRIVSLRNPFVPFMNWMRESKPRGTYEGYDWVCGWFFEVAKPEEVPAGPRFCVAGADYGDGTWM